MPKLAYFNSDNKYQDINEIIDQLSRQYVTGANAPANPEISRLILNSMVAGGIDKNLENYIRQTSGSNPDMALNAINQAIQTYGSSIGNPKDFIGSRINEIRSSPYSDLTDSELNDILGELEGISNLKSVKGLNPNLAYRTGTVDSNELQDIGLPDFGISTDIKDLQELIAQRQEKADQEQQIDSFISSLPEELKRGRDQYLDVLGQTGEDEFNSNVAPQIASRLNARGILYSGDLESELARGSAQVFDPIQQAAQDLAQQDADYFTNAAYQTTLRKEIEAGQNAADAISYQRQQTLNNQNLNFQRTQAELRRSYESQNQQRELDRQLQVQEDNLRRQNNQARSNANAESAGILGSAIGSIAGAYLGGGAGAAAGGTIGSTAGRTTAGKGVTN